MKLFWDWNITLDCKKNQFHFLMTILIPSDEQWLKLALIGTDNNWDVITDIISEETSKLLSTIIILTNPI